MYNKSRIIVITAADLAAVADAGRDAAGNVVSAITQSVPSFSRSTRQTTTWGYVRGPGWSAAHVKRMARKQRNQRRNKSAHRG